MNGTTCSNWLSSSTGCVGPFFLHEVYQAHDSGCTSRITVPVLWDTKLCKIVSNDSWTIVKLFATVFAPLGTSKELNSLMPDSLVAEIEAMQERIYQGLLNGVYRAGIARWMGNIEAAETAAKDVFATLAELEKLLAQSRFLVTDDFPTVVDVRLAMTLLRFDVAYRYAFGLDVGLSGSILSGEEAECGYPNLQNYTRTMYHAFDLGTTVEWRSFRQYYRWAGRNFLGPLPDLERVAASAGQPPQRASTATH